MGLLNAKYMLSPFSYRFNSLWLSFNRNLCEMLEILRVIPIFCEETCNETLFCEHLLCYLNTNFILYLQ